MIALAVSLLLPLAFHAPDSPLALMPAPVLLAPSTPAPARGADLRDLRMVVVGDTGEPGPIVERWRKIVAALPKDAVLVPGDLIYEQAPPCPDGTPDPGSLAIYDHRVGHALGDLGAPTYLVIGNHDVSWTRGEPPRERCLVAYAAMRKAQGLVFPTSVYAVDLGLAMLIVLDTNHFTDRPYDPQATFAKSVIASMKDGQRLILSGHHVLRTYGDKDDEDRLQPWLARHGLRPDLWINGHAHVQQFGIYGGIAALTSGTGAAPRDRPTCPPTCGEGQLFGSSEPGFTVVRVAGPDRHFEIDIQSADGKSLYQWNEARP